MSTRETFSNDLSDWVPLAEAARLLPSCRPGKRVHIATLYRGIARGELECWRIGRWRYVRRGEVLALLRPDAPAGGAAVPVPPKRLTRRQAEKAREEFT